MYPRPPLNPKSLGQRLTEPAEQSRHQAGDPAANAERERLLDQARELDTAANIRGWLSSPELKAPS
ncbi:hypothetical protein [Rhodopseudomonas sp. NSM]|uniref:hypothetical protein n=1 Tax=Rhodopseudomonas sp. NSM TaxID=3457630 RepID=UPI0040360080